MFLCSIGIGTGLRSDTRQSRNCKQIEQTSWSLKALTVFMMRFLSASLSGRMGCLCCGLCSMRRSCQVFVILLFLPAVPKVWEEYLTAEREGEQRNQDESLRKTEQAAEICANYLEKKLIYNRMIFHQLAFSEQLLIKLITFNCRHHCSLLIYVYMRLELRHGSCFFVLFLKWWENPFLHCNAFFFYYFFFL